MQKNVNDIAIFLIVVSALILLLVSFVVAILFLYRKKQMAFLQTLEQAKLDHEKNILSAQLEMQEQTFRHISREIHDNISLSLTLAKLQLNTFDWNNKNKAVEKISSTIGLLSQSIHDLNNISKSLNGDIFVQQGLLRAVENEILRIRETGIFNINFELTGTPVYINSENELIIFRIIQEAFNNVIKHANANTVLLKLHYDLTHLHLYVSDNGKGFDPKTVPIPIANGAGLKNMETRVKMINGSMHLKSQPGGGTSLSFFIPLDK